MLSKMTQLSELERQRQENIQRNKDILRKLNISSISDSIGREAEKKAHRTKRHKTHRNNELVKKEQKPSRRSSRLAGIKIEDSTEYRKLREQQEREQEKREELEKLRHTRLIGDISLIDLVTDKKLGDLKFESSILGGSNGDVKEDEGAPIKEESPNNGIKEEENSADIKDDNQVLKILQDLGDKFSAGDFCDLIRKYPSQNANKSLEEKRSEFDKLKLYEKFDPLDIKVTHQRITAINVHPSKDSRIITAGDKVGNLGFWTVDTEQEETPATTILKPHGKSISKILTSYDPSKLISASYDGSVRMMDFNKLVSVEVAYLRYPDESDDVPMGISDVEFASNDSNLLYFTTLSGNFYQHDLREPFKFTAHSLSRLHDKKIGGFAVNPNSSHQIATASLDRSLRIWDLRNICKSNASWSEYLNQKGPHPYGCFTSRLSISCVDWNYDDRLVCNGYDNYINIIDLRQQDTKHTVVEEWDKSFQPNTTTVDNQVIPDNLHSMTKIRHNCQTGRWVSILKARWQPLPSDGVQKFIIANMNRSLDVYDENANIIAHLTDYERIGAVPAVCSFHPTENWCVGGSASGKLYLFE